MNYLGELPDELVLIIIEYIDIIRDRTKSVFIKEMEGICNHRLPLRAIGTTVVNLSNRYNNLYENYMKLIYLGVINYFKLISYNDLKFNMTSKDYNLLISDIDSVYCSGSILDVIEHNLNKLYNKSLYKNTSYILIYFLNKIIMPYFSNVELHIIIINNNKYYYINFIYKEDIFNTNNYGSDGQSVKIKEYDNWNLLINNLSNIDLFKLYDSNGYEVINRRNH